jgi:hypothetical protein
MRVRIVCYEDCDQWILVKFANKLNEELRALSIDSDVANFPDPKADINHHIIYYHFDCTKNPIDTLMITHIDSVDKTKRIKRQLAAADMGICMSLQTVEQLAASGIPRDRLCYVNPAHDNVIKPRKTVIGLTTRLYSDGRKKEDYLLRIAEKINADDFSFKIMGNGWQSIVDRLLQMGFSVEYFSEFDYDTYVSLVPSFDYYLYFSSDEGSMGFVDALAAGVKTIVTPQGFHLDAPGGITHPINSMRDTIAALEKISQERRMIAATVSRWTWGDYARKHLGIWEFLMEKRSTHYFMEHSHCYTDGLGSIILGNARPISLVSKLKVRLKVANKSLSFFKGDLKKRYVASAGAKMFMRLLKK